MASGNVDVEGGGLRAREAYAPLKLFGEDRTRPRIKLELMRMMETLQRCLARELVLQAGERCEASAADTDIGLPVETLLLAEAQAHEAAGEMLRARIRRLTRPPTAKVG